jgi:hypothetical protein
MPKCSKCGNLVETRAQKAARISGEDMKKGLKIGGKGIFNAIRHPVQTYKKAFKQKPQYPEKCNRNCALKNDGNSN